MRQKHVLIGLLLFLALVLTACGGADDDADITVELAVTPDPPLVGEATIVVTLRDGDGELVSGAEMELEGTMTHAGMVPVLSAGCRKRAGPLRGPAKIHHGRRLGHHRVRRPGRRDQIGKGN